jgi:hypothetical protein
MSTNSGIPGRCHSCGDDCAAYTPSMPLDPEVCLAFDIDSCSQVLQSDCYCNHGCSQHMHPAANFPPQGGLQMNGISCLGYWTVQNSPVSLYLELMLGNVLISDNR